MALYQIKDDTLLPLESTSFQDEDILERKDLQRWLKDDISVIAPDDDIIIISEEFSDWDDSSRSIDLLAIDKEANLVVIELKRTEDGGHMELQAIRYAAMISNMTWEEAINAFRQYIEKNELEINAEATLCDFLEWDTPREDKFAQNVRIILASQNFSKEITTSVLWLNQRELDITCVRLSLHKLDGQLVKLDGQLVLSADQIIPLPEAESYQIEVKQKRQKERASKHSQRDYSLFSISYSGEIYEKGFKKINIGYYTVKLLEDKGLLDADAFEFLRADRSSSFQLLKTLEEIPDKEKKPARYRYKNEPEINYNGQGYYVARNWGKDNIGDFIEKIIDRFPEIKFEKLDEF